MSGNRYHFFRYVKHGTGGSFYPVPGQVLGRDAVNPAVLIKDKRGCNDLYRLRKFAKPGDVFFTTSLSKSGHTYVVNDAYPLIGHEIVFYDDAETEYKSLCLKNELTRKR